MTTDPYEHGTPSAHGLVSAGWWSRVGAFVIDGLLTAVPILLLGSLAGAHPFGHRDAAGHTVNHVPWWYAVGGLIVSWGYQLLTQCRPGPRNGQTIGKQLLGIAVIRDDARPFSPVTFLVRDVICKNLIWWSRFLSALTLPFTLLSLLDDLWPLWDRENRALHDFVARTHVVRA